MYLDNVGPWFILLSDILSSLLGRGEFILSEVPSVKGRMKKYKQTTVDEVEYLVTRCIVIIFHQSLFSQRPNFIKKIYNFCYFEYILFSILSQPLEILCIPRWGGGQFLQRRILIFYAARFDSNTIVPSRRPPHFSNEIMSNLDHMSDVLSQNTSKYTFLISNKTDELGWDLLPKLRFKWCVFAFFGANCKLHKICCLASDDCQAYQQWNNKHESGGRLDVELRLS